jgi:hypothetical protein
VIGYFRGWFTFQTNSDGSRSNIELSIDKERLQQDMDRLKEKVHELSDKEKNDQEIENK